MWAVLLAAALAAAGGATRAQQGVGASGHFAERMTAASAAEARRVHLEQLRRVSRAEAHARMPSTMYASTPSPPGEMPSWHPVLVEPETEESDPLPALPGSALPRSGTGGVYRIPLFAAASNPLGRQGFVRIVNRSDRAGEVRIAAFDDSGMPGRSVTLPIGANETVHFNSDDLEKGNDKKGIEDGTGPPEEGNWRLELASPLDLEVLSYMRTKNDGFLTSLHDLVPRTGSGHRVVTFNPGKNRSQESWLRLMNPEDEAAEVRIEGIDDKGRSPDEVVEVTVPAGASRMLSAAELEGGGDDFTGALGTGSGKWQLMVSSERAIEVMSLLSSPTGHLTNLSGVPGNAEPGEAGAPVVHGIPLFPAKSRWERNGYQGFARIINRTAQEGEVRVEAWDDEGTRRGPVTLSIGAKETLHFNSEDLEDGNPKKEWLSEGIGPPGTGDWRLRLSSTLTLDVLAYIRTRDGFLTSVHDVAPGTEAGHRVVTFNPGSNENQESSIRLINPGDVAAEVTIEGTDDEGASPGSAVLLSLAGGASRTLTARELESGDGEGLSGGLGDGSGKWRLMVTSDQSVQAMSLLSTPTGHLTNLSSVPAGTVAALPTVEMVFRDRISGPIVQAKCVNCHVEGGAATLTDLKFVRSSNPGHEALNFEVFKDFLADEGHDGKYILSKIQGGSGHGGGPQVPVDTPGFADMERFLRLLGEDVTSASLTPRTLFDTVRMAPTPRVLRRAALVFAGRIPTEAEHAAARRGGAALRATIRGLMTGPQFHEFLIRAANDRLLTDREIGSIDSLRPHLLDYNRDDYRRAVAAHASGTERAEREYNEWLARVDLGSDRAPLELIAHVVENDLPYTEVLTADYIMANPWAAAAYGASTRFDDPDDLYEFQPSEIVSYYRKGEGYEEEDHPVVDTSRILSPGPLITDYPHAGILNTTVFLGRYPTTATNRNRARSRWTYYHFLGLDIEKSAPRTTDPDALADTNNPTMFNPACTVCHRVLDPVAGAFQNYFDEGQYKTNWGGIDSLDEFYTRGPDDRQDGDFLVTASSWTRRHTFSKTVTLTKDRSSVRLSTSRDFQPTPSDEAWWNLGFAERLTIRDSAGSFVKHQELGNPECGDWSREVGRRFFVMYFPCRIMVPVEVPDAGDYLVEVETWIDSREEDARGLPVELAMDVGGYYREGDTWYRDMRVPGFGDEIAPSSDNTVQWLAERIVADERFAEATVKFWWPAIMGSEVAEPPEDEGDAGFEGLLLAANAQAAEVGRLATGFRHGFHGGPAYNLKDLLVEIALSRWFRADALDDDDPVRRIALEDAGARRLLTPEELARKTAALTGFSWGRDIRDHCFLRPGCDPRPNALTDEYRLLYGGIDSDGITERARDITAVMEGVARTHALGVSCPVVLRELYLAPERERRLFSGIDPFVTPRSEFSASFEIRAGSPSRRETLSFGGRLSAGPKTVTLTYLNDFWEPPNNDRNVRLDRLVVRDAAGRTVTRRELETLAPVTECNRPAGDHFALHCGGSVEVPIEVPAPGDYELEIVAWADQAGDELPRLSAAVESAAGPGHGAGLIREKLVELHEKLLGVQVTPYSPDVEAAYGLFVDVWERKRELQGDDNWELTSWSCGLDDIFYFEGLLDDVIVRRESESGYVWYEHDWDRINDFWDEVDLSDPQAVAQTWVVVLAYLLMDYRYLYL